jgi:membrane protein implicated in regulation of membrane protease activity
MGHARAAGSRWWYALLLIPIVALLATPIYAKADPTLFGFPFFYWYQFAWVPLSVVVTWFVYTRTRTRGAPPDERRDFEGVPFEPGPRAPEREVTR